jgi:hypothetical protein
MLIYLDMCCFNRPFDDQTQARIRFETEAKLLLQQHVREGGETLVWSYVLDYENSINPFADRQESITPWRSIAKTNIVETEQIVSKAKQLTLAGIKPFDALHVACAIAGGADMFISTDDQLLRRMRSRSEIRAMLPGEALAQVENWYED